MFQFGIHGEKFRKDQEMIKGLENGHFEARLKALFSSEERKLGSDLITILENMKGGYGEGRTAVFHLYK